jgi:hypothetical protein
MGSDQQDVGHSGIAARRGAIRLSAIFHQWGERTPTDGSFTLAHYIYLRSVNHGKNIFNGKT